MRVLPRNCNYGNAIAIVLLLLLALLDTASAGVVSNDDYRAQSSRHSVSTTKLDNRGRVRLDVSLDLSGYRDAALSFNFDALMRRNGAEFETESVPGMRYIDDFQLLDPMRRRFSRARGRNAAAGGFRSRSTRGMFSTAMFNLAAYDGQSVLLSLEFNRRNARRRGVVSIDNLRVRVLPRDTAFAGASIPEPGRLSLVLIAAAGLLIFALGHSRRSAPDSPLPV